MTLPAAIVDVDGTLVDTNYHHTLAWYRAFRRHGIVLPLWRIHRHIGMGGDQLVSALCGERTERERGDAIREDETGLYGELIEEVEPLAGARELIVELRRRGHAVVLASSAKAQEVDHYLDLLDARELVEGWTTSADVEATKPEPDLVAAGMEISRRLRRTPKGQRGSKAASNTTGGGEAVMIGDSIWDVEAARRAGIPTIAVLTGGYSENELLDAGAAVVFDSLERLRERRGETPLG
jgi:phosphoglycolate phosphatase-like HAD superfamily hydrolase